MLLWLKHELMELWDKRKASGLAARSEERPYRLILFQDNLLDRCVGSINIVVMAAPGRELTRFFACLCDVGLLLVGSVRSGHAAEGLLEPLRQKWSI
jgi:hypothetical protein